MINQGLKCVIFGDRDVIQNDEFLPEVEKLIQFLIDRKIKPVIISNDNNYQRQDLKDKLTKQYQELSWYITSVNGIPKKPKKESIDYILKNLSYTNSNVIYVGNSDVDMKTAVNSKLLFLNAAWEGQKTTYGFKFNTPKEIARFIEIFCLRKYFWAYEIKDNDLEYYALGIYGTLERKYDYSLDAREAAKFGRGHSDFWIKYLLSAVYFSGLHQQIDFITSYPGHQQGSTASMEINTIITFAKCFQKKYLPNLIERHTTSQKSSYARTKGKKLNHFNQLNTIKLNKFPDKDDRGNKYKQSPLKIGKTVLVMDDFCTQGYSLDSARIYIQNTGAKVILLSLLKTISCHYEKLINVESFNPFIVKKFTTEIETKRYLYNKHIVENTAHQEIRSKLEKYNNWDW